MPILEQNSLFFFHIPRCGGTSIERYFGVSGKEQFYGVVKNQDEVVTLHHLPACELIRRGYMDWETLSTCKKFTIIRDPFERSYSDYCWQKRYDAHQIFSGLSFADYLDFAENVIENERYFEKIHFDHFRPFSDYFHVDGELVLDDVLVLECLDEDLARANIVDKNRAFPRLNGSTDAGRGELPQELRDRVNEIYSTDRLLYESILNA